MLTPSPFKEEFMHFLWRTKKLMLHTLQTTDGVALEILEYGTYNLDAGPDFSNAKIKIEDTIWVGNIEMHVFASDWKKHKHQLDKAYDNVILHVVYEHDAEVHIGSSVIPTLELKGKIPKSFLENYLNLVQSQDDIPCHKMIHSVAEEKIALWKYSLAIERLQYKSEMVESIYHSKAQDWEETLYIMLARYFGARVNTEPFEQLARSLPLNIVLKNKDKRETLDALFFGQAGMLKANYEDAYFVGLRKEYEYQQKKYQLKPIDAVAWKFGKLRPMNFPTVRIAQFAGLMFRVSFLFSQIKEAENTTEIKQILMAEVSEYWNDHYRFGKESSHQSKKTSSDMIDLLLINAVSPVLFLYGKLNDEELYIDKAIEILESVSPENNIIIKQWKSVGIPSKSAFDTQALIHLKNNYCNELRCLSCKIGHEVMGK
jgi:hypothetical protein